MQIPVNPNVTIEAMQLYEYLRKSAGRRIVSGQHIQGVDGEEVEYIKKLTGCEPKIRGFDLMSCSPNINFSDASKECIDEVKSNKGSLEVALTWGISANHIVELTFKWFSPIGGRDKSYYSKNTSFNPEKILEYGTQERRAFFDDMDTVAITLRRFMNVHIPILFRPFHQSDEKWFWWGRNGIKVAKELYLLMFDYYVNVHHLNNLLWVWSSADPEGYPGDDYVDIVGVDVFGEKYTSTDYKSEYGNLITNTSDNKIVALTDLSYPPDMAKMKKSKVPWTYFMLCTDEEILKEDKRDDAIKKAYENDMVASI